VAIAFAGTHPERVDRLVVVDIGPDIAPGGRLRVGMLMAQTPERFDDFAAAVAWARAANPRYTETMLRHRVTHGTRPANGGLVWKYDRAIRDAVRSGQWRDPVDLWPLWSAITCPTLIVRGAESDVLGLLAVRLLHGCGMGLYPTAASAVVADLAPPARRGAVMGTFGAAANIAMALAPIAGLAVADRLGFVPLFQLAACVAVVALL